MIAKNLEQMIEVLHLRLTSIGEAAKIRKEYSDQDTKSRSRLQSSQLPSMVADYDDLNSKNPAKESSKSSYQGHSKEFNLVSTEGIFVDPQKLGNP